jgi:tRNA(Ile)-lysidine synthase
MSALTDALFSSALAQQLLTRASFPDRTQLHCAVSGGADSLALLALATRTERHVSVWHVDHGLRAESADEFAFVRSICEQLNVECTLRSVEVAPGPNLEARARDARYAVLPDDVLTGHTADDQAETVLINLLRGSGTAGLAGMRRADRPLLGIRRSETHALCAELGITPLHDTMNDDHRFQRVRVRDELMPLLVDIAKRDMVEVLARQATVLREDDDVLEELASMLDPTDARTLCKAPRALARRSIRRWLSNPKPPDLATVERVLAVACGDAGACDIGQGRSVRRSHQRLEIHLGHMR